MKIERTGFILYTINYEACASFYKEVLNLPILYVKESLTCFEFGGSYLMVELDDEAERRQASLSSRDKTCLRINVRDVRQACKTLDDNQIKYDYQENDWGTIAKFRDPDGNLIAFRSAKEHEQDQLS